MKSLLLAVFLISPYFLSGQIVRYDTSRTYDGIIYWTGQLVVNENGKPPYYKSIYYYSDGKKQLETVSDTQFVSSLMINEWTAEGEQIIKNGNGIHIENYQDSVVYSVQDSIIKGPAWFYRRYSRNNYFLPLKLRVIGYYADGFRNGEWVYIDTNGIKEAVINYKQNEVSGKCTIYYPLTNKIKEEGTIGRCGKTGLWRSYDENGNLSVECNYEYGEKTGSYISYYSNGKIKSKGQYKHVTKKFKIPVEDPKHPGDFSRIHRKLTLTNVHAKTGTWYFYNENGDSVNSKKYKSEKEVPEYLEPIKFRKRHFYYVADKPFAGIPDCNYD